MKTYLFLAGCFVFLLMSCNPDQIVPSETITTENHELATISALTASSDFKVFYTHSAGPQTVSVEANENLQERVKLNVNNGRLHVKLKNNTSIRGSETLILRLHTAAPINDFHANSDAEINIETPLTLNNLFLKASSDGIIRGTVDVEDMEVEASSDGRLELLGEANMLNANLSSDAVLSDFDFMVNHLKIKLSSDAKGELTVIETLEANAVSDAILRYMGNPEILRLDTSSDGRIEQVN